MIGDRFLTGVILAAGGSRRAPAGAAVQLAARFQLRDRLQLAVGCTDGSPQVRLLRVERTIEAAPHLAAHATGLEVEQCPVGAGQSQQRGDRLIALGGFVREVLLDVGVVIPAAVPHLHHPHAALEQPPDPRRVLRQARARGEVALLRRRPR